MKQILRIYLGVTLALMLALTGQSMAVARGTTGPTGQMVLCTGTGPVMVYVDENGAPTGPPVFCPDCALNLLVALALPDMAALPDVSNPVVLPVRVTPVQGAKPRSHAMARAPPRVV